MVELIKWERYTLYEYFNIGSNVNGTKLRNQEADLYISLPIIKEKAFRGSFHLIYKADDKDLVRDEKKLAKLRSEVEKIA